MSSSIYQENKNFVNKYKALLLSKFKAYAMERRVVLCMNDTRFSNINMWVHCKIENDIFITEASKKLYFCVKLKEYKRLFGTRDDDDNKLAIFAYMSNLDMYSITLEKLEDMRKFLIKKGVKGIGSKPISELDDRSLLYQLKRYPEEMYDYPDIKDCEKAIKALKDSPIEIYRHPDIHKSIKNKELIPISWLADNCLVYPNSSIKKRTSTSFLEVDRLEYATPNLARIAQRTESYAPITSWCVLDLK